MKIVHLASEFAPFAKAGGLGDVLTGLSRALTQAGHHVEVVIPKYDFIPESSLPPLEKKLHDFYCREKGQSHRNTLWSFNMESCHLHLLETHHPKGYFSRGKIYACDDDIARFLYFSKACLEYLRERNEPIDILHLHDWPVSIAAVLSKEMYKLPIRAIALTIHNADYQGRSAPWDLDAIELHGAKYLTKDLLQDNRYHDAINLLKGGIVFADIVNTVSVSYAKEILTPEIGGDLSATLSLYQDKIRGITNGIDYHFWDPSRDPSLQGHYHASLSSQLIEKGKQSARNQLRRHFGKKLEQRPWVGAITRIVPQKGPEFIEEGLKKTLDLNGSFLLLGSSPIPSLRHHFEQLKKKYESCENVLFHFEYDESLAHQIYAGLDFLLLPSHFEPCGLSQMIGMHYGTIPIVRATGGLQDTVFDFENTKVTAEKRNGFVFQNATSTDFSSALTRAFELFRKSPEMFQILAKRGMQQNFSWEKPALEYIKMYTEVTYTNRNK